MGDIGWDEKEIMVLLYLWNQILGKKGKDYWGGKIFKGVNSIRLRWQSKELKHKFKYIENILSLVMSFPLFCV